MSPLVFTYLFYTLLMIGMIIPSYAMAGSWHVENKRKYWMIGMGVVIVYALLIGLRYEVGTDYENYRDWFKTLRSTGLFPVDNSDAGYLLLNKMLAGAGAHYVWLFIIIAFLHLFFLFKSLKNLSFLLPWYLFYFFTCLFFFSSMNHMRQTIAYFMFFYSLFLFFEKKYWQVFFLIVLAASFHKSVLIFVWVYPLLKYDLYKNRVLQVFLLVLVCFIAEKLFTVLFSTFSSTAGFFGYGYYIENVDMINEKSAEFATGAGLGKYLFFVIDIIIIVYSTRLKEVFKEQKFTAFYNLYFTGALLENIFASNYILSRSADYLSDFRVLILSFLSFYLIRKKVNRGENILVLVFILLLMLAYFYRGISSSAANCTPFRFIF